MDMFDFKPRLVKEAGNKFPITLPKDIRSSGSISHQGDGSAFHVQPQRAELSC